MDSNASGPQAHSLGVVTKDDVLLIGSQAYLIVSGEASLYADGTLCGTLEKQPLHVEIVEDFHDDGARVFEISRAFTGQWR